MITVTQSDLRQCLDELFVRYTHFHSDSICQVTREYSWKFLPSSNPILLTMALVRPVFLLLQKSWPVFKAETE